MPSADSGSTPAGFRMQLLRRLNDHAREQKIAVQRLQQQVAFERLLARLAGSGQWILKGGFALQLRFGWGNRPTRDIDLRTETDIREAVVRLRSEVAESSLSDQFTFDLGELENELQGAPGSAIRIPVVARVAGVVLARFHIDLASGDAVIGPPVEMQGSNLLDFAGFQRLRFPVYPITQHLAEKLHAYTLPRDRENSRAKDLVDLVTIVAVEAVDGRSLTASLHATFTARNSHSLPASFPEPPRGWAAAYRKLAGESLAVVSADLSEGYRAAARFWDPVLTGEVEGSRWDVRSKNWQACPSAQA